jgi:hypothetical protein
VKIRSAISETYAPSGNTPLGPEPIFNDLANSSHLTVNDTVRAPEIARNFDCLPEQLLERVRQLPDYSGQ